MDRGHIALLALASLVVLVALVQTVRLRRVGSLGSRRARARGRIAREGELSAARLLRAAGYRVVDQQVARALRVHVDGRPVDVGVRADFVVRRGRRRFVAEVKTGERAPRIEHGPTRRQLLEYALAFDVDGVLLVDASRERVHTVAFDHASPRPHRHARAWLLLGLAALALAAAAILL